MRKGEKTKLHIIMKSAELFNQKGYVGTTMQDIIDATGLTKGGIYRNFANKDEIAIEAFQYAGGVLWSHFAQAMEGKETALDKILAMASVYSDTVHNPPIQGGCPFLNTAVESDHSFPVIRDHAVHAFEQMLAFIQGILMEGIMKKEFREDMNTESVGSFIFTAIEGGIMASRLMRDNKHVEYATRQIEALLLTYKN
ncbi:TetR/AcrR family transcriptional regulator [Paenibacillus sp. JCM 10914]|uniref:TetR/AcrR family transcriptional regulator n=1 Tax=Paenibacillus sp. JCM 10914 TaxID=1236974 RepID=UPI0003CC2672|nr:TetR/AcrR family transcriptional regulator [Paenibacillus sp. JCM 10914]GAE09347.1 transcriptional regulator, TetR family [Paenibacillus sp. JCM 10914]